MTTMTRLNQFALALCFLIVGAVDGYTRHERRLRYDLLSNYDKHTLPGESTTVDFSLSVKHFEMNEQKHSLMVEAWMINEWVDPRLQWNMTEYYGIHKLTIPHTLIWKPDLDVYNSATVGDSISYGNTLVLVHPTGKVLFIPPVKLHFTCVMDLTYWPHDTHNCTCIFGSWVHDGFAIDLRNMYDKPEMDLPMRLTEDGRNLTRGSWNLLEANIVRDVKTYNDGLEPYVTIHISMLVTRNAPAYSWIIKGPALGLCILTLVMFVLPPSAGEKMTFGVLCLLLDMIFIGYSSFIISMAPTHTPLIVEMVCKQVILVIASLVVGAFSLRLARDPHTSGLSPVVRRPLLLLSGCLCLQSYKNLVSKAHRQPYGRTLKSDEFELRENGNGNGHVYSGEVSSSPGLDWLLLAAVIDRLCLIVFIVIFIVNMISFSKVL